MRSPRDGFSKIWIYLPLYLIVTGLTVWLLYYYLNRPKPQPPSTFVNCFDEGRKHMDGVISITPARILEQKVKRFPQSCADEICAEMEAIANYNSSSARFYGKAYNGNPCFGDIITESTIYHNKKVEKLPHIVLFYNSGQYKLRNDQKRKLDDFIRSYDNYNYRLLAIGRASSTGNRDSNKKLSRKRTDVIDNYVNVEHSGLQNNSLYFGDYPPQLDIRLAKRFRIPERDYKNIVYGKGSDRDFKLRLNQSVLIVLYPKANDPFEVYRD